MKIGMILFDGLTFLDFVGFYDGVIRLKNLQVLKDLSWDLCALTPQVRDSQGLVIKVDKVKPDLAGYDMLFIPGGLATRKLKNNKNFVAWVQQGASVPYKVSVCTGSLILGAAGFLKDKKATTHPRAYDELKPYCREVLANRVVKDGKVITGGGVATSIDLGIFVAEELAGKQVGEAIKKGMDYPYENEDIQIIGS